MQISINGHKINLDAAFIVDIDTCLDLQCRTLQENIATASRTEAVEMASNLVAIDNVRCGFELEDVENLRKALSSSFTIERKADDNGMLSNGLRLNEFRKHLSTAHGIHQEISLYHAGQANFVFGELGLYTIDVHYKNHKISLKLWIVPTA